MRAGRCTVVGKFALRVINNSNLKSFFEESAFSICACVFKSNICKVFLVLLMGKIQRQVNPKESSRIIITCNFKSSIITHMHHSYQQITWLNQVDFCQIMHGLEFKKNKTKTQKTQTKTSYTGLI